LYATVLWRLAYTDNMERPSWPFEDET
jgi:hypothetical protein